MKINPTLTHALLCGALMLALLVAWATGWRSLSRDLDEMNGRGEGND